MGAKRLKARHLIVVEGKTQKAVAALVGVSTRTMNLWVKHYNWNKEADEELLKKENSIWDSFLTHLKVANPELSNSIKTALDEYIDSL